MGGTFGGGGGRSRRMVAEGGKVGEMGIGAEGFGE